MTQNRRAAVRRRATLPFAWTAAAPGASHGEICRLLGLPAGLLQQSRLAELDDEFKLACASLTEPRLADALRALARKIEVLEETVLAHTPEPPSTAVELSADGVGFAAPKPPQLDDRIAVHLVLPIGYHIVARARVSRSDPQAGGEFQVGAEFEELGAPAGRRLTRWAISRDREEPTR